MHSAAATPSVVDPQNERHYRYTCFPNLHNGIDLRCDAREERYSHKFKLSEGLRRDAVVEAWALLLCGYTGADSVVFRVDDSVLCFEPENGSTDITGQPLLGQNDGADSTGCAVYFSKRYFEASAPMLYLHADLEATEATLAVSSAVVDSSHVPQMASQLLHITAALLASPCTNGCTSAFPRDIWHNYSGLSILNPNRSRAAGPELLHELGQLGNESPTDKPALEFLRANGETDVLSYRELHDRSDHLARQISAALASGTGRRTVPVLLPQSTGLYVALLAILKAGAAFVPLNLDAPQERIRFVVGDVDAGIILTDSQFEAKFQLEGAPPMIILDDSGNATGDWDSQPVVRGKVSASEPAYIMYTSGSTGTPKGVTISHSAATQSLLAHDEHIPKFQRFLQFAAPTFDVSVFEIFFPLFRGCTLVACDRGRLLADLPGVINELNIDAAELTPTVAGSLLGHRENVPGLKVLLTIGEMLTRQVVDEFGGGGILHGMYGPTEAAIHCTLASPFRAYAKVGDIGKPLRTVSALVVATTTSSSIDPVARLRPLPTGWVGELVVGGHQLAEGYLNRPELTSEAFMESAEWGRLYRTGDRARILPSGVIECLGRVSAGQVKLRGQRVELGEVEEIVLKTPGVRTAVASVVENSMVVYIAADTSVETGSVKDVCAQWLPRFMIPSDVVVYEELPTLPSGKADRKGLDKSYTERKREQREDEDEQLTEQELVVVRAVQELLRLRPRRYASLTSLGLDSILAIKLVSLLRNEGIRIEVLDVLKADSVAGVATAAERARSALEQPPSESTSTKEIFLQVREQAQLRIPEQLWEDVEDIAPCTSLQEAMILETARDSGAYCNWVLLELPAGYSSENIETAFKKLVEANEMLRTGFVPLDSGFAQVVWKRPQKRQFRVLDAIEESWSVSLDNLLAPPFSVGMLREGASTKLSVRIHHALYDGWSWEHIISDFQTLLAGGSLAVKRRPFSDVVRWELERPEPVKESTRQFWRDRLEGAGQTALPSFHGHEDVAPGVSVESLDLSVARADYEAAARRTGVSPQVIVQTAWAYLLSFYVGSGDVVFGTVVSGRTEPLPGIEDIIGPTILTLPLRVYIRRDGSVAEVQKDVHTFNRAILEHSQLGLREVKKACGGSGGFDSLLVWQQTLNSNAGGDIRLVDGRDRLEFSLLIEAEPHERAISLRATYKDEVFPRSQAHLMLGQIDQLIFSMVHDPSRKLCSLLASLDSKALSVENTDAPRITPSPTRTLATVFEETAAEYPDSTAVEFASSIVDGEMTSETLTYSELNMNSNRLARHLVSLGVEQDKFVAVCMEKSLLCYTSILAAVKAGAGYLPLTPETPRERVKQILLQAEAKVLLSTRDVAATLDLPEGMEVVLVDATDYSHYEHSNLDIERRAETLAYAVFTSGSTGVPKGVLVEHAQAVANMDVLSEMYPAEHTHRMLQFCNIAFDVSVFEIFFAWRKGMCLCSATKDTFLRDLESAVNALRATHLSMTPTVAALVKSVNVPQVEFLVTSGEAVTRKVFNDWAGNGLWQGYGPSETTNICTVKPRVRPTEQINNIGPPFSNTSAFVVLPDVEPLNIVPRGGIGELCFGGLQVCRGYLKMPELTSQKFIVHPTYGRLYRSGDIGKLLPNGDIQFVGREDDQVKVRGNRIELGEINSVLLRSEHIADTTCLVISKPGEGPESNQLVSFVELSEWRSKEFGAFYNVGPVQTIVTALFKTLADILPIYMVPSAIVPVSKIPVTSQGKTDKKLLIKTFFEINGGSLAPQGGTSGQDHKPSDWTPAEQKAAAVISDLAKVALGDVGRNTSIFSLGLDSLSAIQLSARLGREGLKRLDVSQIMRNPTVAGLASLLKNEEVSPPAESHRRHALDDFSNAVTRELLEQLNLSPEDLVKILPCTPLQEAMLSLKKGADPKMFYNHTTLRLNVDAEKLRHAWSVISRRHEITRTCFGVTSHPQHAYAQVVLREHQLPWDTIQVNSEHELTDVIDMRISEVSMNMDPSRPPYCFSLFTSQSETILVMSFHHSLYDGFAMDLLLEDVRRAYNDLELPDRSPFDPYLEFMENIDLDAADSFWKEKLHGLEPSSFPDLTGKSTSYRKQLQGMISRSYVSATPLDVLENGCRGLSASLLALGQTAWARLLSVYTGEADLCFGNVVSGRTTPVEGVEGIIAPCFNTVPIRVGVSADSTNRSVMEYLQQFNAELLPFQLTPLRRLMTALRTDGQGLFDTLFILQHKTESAFESMWEEVEDRGEMDFSLVVELVPSRNRNTLELIIHFRRDLVLEMDAELLLQQLDATIVSTIESPEELAADFSVFPTHLSSIANPEPAVLPGENAGLLHSEFEKNAEHCPNKTALEFMNYSGQVSVWTFGELNMLANRMAHKIVSFGLPRDAAIPICIEKSPSFYVAVLAVLKAGCAFTPIDPSLPAQRKNFMINELGAKAVLANSSIAEELQLPLEALVLDVESDNTVAGQPIHNPVIPDLTPENLAYRLYTSGSTGQPKAVSLEHRSAVQTFRASRSLIPWKQESRLLQFAATTFDMCYYDCFMAWSYGFTLCTAARNHLLDDLEATIRKLRVTFLDLTPTVATSLHAEALPDVELLYCIGEAMPQKLVNDWEGRCVNSYGPTEAAMCCTITKAHRDIKASNIGSPFPTASFHILSPRSGSTMPLFASGELCIGGPQIAREYHNNQELTKSRFIQHGEETVYRTGDIVRQLSDGTFEFIGRADDQVKIRGLRVELDEINTVMRAAHPAIKDASTIVWSHSEQSKKQLVTFLALRDRGQHGIAAKVVVDQSEIPTDLISSAKQAAQASLPRYMVPGVVLVVDRIPLSAAGKVDKKSLGALFREQDIQSFSQDVAMDEVESWSEDELKVRRAFSEISQVPEEHISRNSTIYEIGLDSISASQVAMRLRKLQLPISALDILERPSIELLSPLLTSKQSDLPNGNTQAAEPLLEFRHKFLQSVLSDTGLKEETLDGIYPCTAAQEGMLSQFLRTQGKLYFNHTLLKLPGNTNIEMLRQAWESTFEALAILRSGFVEIDDSEHKHSFAMLTHANNAANLPWAVVEATTDIAGMVKQQKLAAASRALGALHLPPWEVVVFKESQGGDSSMLFSGHHALYDATSLQIILQDVAARYEGRNIEERPGFEKAICEISRHITDPWVVESDREFWLKQLEGSNITKLPNLCPRRVASDEFHVETLQSTLELSSIETACQKLGVSVHALGQAAWARVLSAYVGESVVTLGIVFSGRTGLEAQDVTFPCLVTLPSLASTTGTNRDLVLQIQESNSRLLKHQHTPLKSIQRWLGHPEEALFDSIFVYQKMEKGKEALPWEITDEEAAVDYKLSLEIEPTAGDHLLFRTTSKESHIPNEQAALLLHQFDAALKDILENPHTSSNSFVAIPQELLSVTPAAVEEIPCDVKLLHQFVEKYSRLMPQKTAFEFVTALDGKNVQKKSWTYTQLNQEGNKVANFLLDNGVKTGQIIGVCFEKCPEASFAMLGVLKAGCGYVALDYNAPIDRKAFIVTDCKAPFVLTTDKYCKEMQAAMDARVVSMESEAAIANSSTETPVVQDVAADNLCYCLYTSGTTGTPKGCELTHENAVQAMLAFQRLFAGHWDEESRFLQFAAFHFDVSVLEQYWSWSVGICITSAPRDLIFQDLANTIQQLGITHLDLTPSLAALLDPEDVPSLWKGVFITGGEALRQDILDKWGAIGAIYNGYGPTEVTIGCTMYPRVPADGKPSNIGPQFDNVGSYVFAPGTEDPVPRGAVGELCVSGKLVGRGYLNRQSLTEEKFPVLKHFKERIYRTGDLVRILHDGTFDFAGRADDQVKLRGQRLEIGEINEVMKKADSRVHAIATLVLRHPKQQKDQLVSFVVVDNNKGFTEQSKPVLVNKPENARLIAALTDACRSKLPTYMAPTHFLPISTMPLSINNKVDNKVLKALYSETTLDVLQRLTKREDNEDAKWSETETRLRSVLANVTKLHTSNIHRSSTVFELGLDSVSVVGLARRLKRAGFATATVSLIMQHPGVSHLAEALSTNGTEPAQELGRLESAHQQVAAFGNKHMLDISEQLQLDPDDIEAIIPCSPLQEGIIARFLDSTEPIYFNSFPLGLHPSVDLTLLRDAWNSVIQSTDILQTCFCQTPDGYAQVVLSKAELQWDEVSYEHENIEKLSSEGVSRHASHNNDLHLPPLSALISRTPSRVVLILTIFHALYDGNSLPMILDDVEKCYKNSFQRRPIQFGAVIPHMLSLDLKAAQSFWKEVLHIDGLTTFPKLANSNPGRDSMAYLPLDIKSTELGPLCKKFGCTPQAIFQAVWAYVLASYTGPRVTFGIVVSGRSLPMDHIEDVIGPTFNTIPCSLDISKASSWEALVKEAYQFISRSIQFHHTPLRLIHKWLRRSADKPLFDTLFVYQKNDADSDHASSLWNILEGPAVADYPLSLEIRQQSSGDIEMTTVAKGDVANSEQLLKILHRVQSTIHELLRNPEAKPSICPGESLANGTNGTTNGITNGYHTSNGASAFTWDTQALRLKKVIVELAEVDDSEVDEDSSILELGLDSIEAIKLSSRLRKHGLALSVSTIMRNPTIRKMQKQLGKKPPQTNRHKRSSYLNTFQDSVRGRLHDLADDVEAIYPTTPLQEAIVAESLASNYGFYFNHDILALQSYVDTGRLKHTWETVVARNEILRASFFSASELGLETKHAYGQIIHRSQGLKWTEIQVDSDKDIMQEARKAMERATRQTDMLKTPPLCLCLLVGEKARYLVFSISHALYDGWSMGLLHEDVHRAYFSEPAGIAARRPSPRLLLESIFNTDSVDSTRFWRKVLHKCTASSFPVLSNTHSTDGPAQTHRAELVSKVAAPAVQDFCKRMGTTLQVLGQTIWGLLLAHYLGETDVVFGTVLSGRDFESADEIMFPAMNTVPVRAVLHGSYRDLLGYMQERSSATLKHQYAPLREIQRLANTGGRRLFDTLFIYQRGKEVENSEKKLWDSVDGASDVEYNVCVEMERAADRIVWRDACKSSIMEISHAENLLQNLDSLLAHIIQDSDHQTLIYSGEGVNIGNMPTISRPAQMTFNGVRLGADQLSATVKGLSEGITDCTVEVIEEPNNSSLVFFIGGADQDIEEITAHARQELPYWTLPAYLVPVEQISSSGHDSKTGPSQFRDAFLKLSEKQRHQYSTAREATSWSVTERTFRRVFSNVAMIPEDEIERTDTIFQLGLDSISAILLSNDLRKEGIFLSVAEILKQGTIERMAATTSSLDKESQRPVTSTINTTAIIQDALSGIDIAATLSGVSTELEAALPLTAGQLYMISCWKNSNYALFMPTFTFKSARLEKDKIQIAWSALVEQEPILRTAFIATKNTAKPFIQATYKKALPQFEWYETSCSSPAFLRFVIAQEQQRAVNLSVPPVRLCSVSTPTDTVLFLSIHHALYDGVSLPLLLSKLQTLLSGANPEHPKPTGSIWADFIAYTYSQSSTKQQEFWQSHLQSASSTPTPLNHPNLPATQRTSHFQPAALTDVSSLNLTCRKAGVSLQALFLACFARVYAHQLNAYRSPVNTVSDVVFGVYLANRQLPVAGVDSMAAPTLNIVPLCVRGAGREMALPLLELAQAVQQTLVEISSPQNSVVDLVKIVEWTGVSVDCFVNFLKLPGGEEEGAGGLGGFTEVNIEMDSAPRGYSGRNTLVVPEIKTNLDVEIAVRGNNIDIGVFSTAKYLDDADVRSTVEWICELVRGVA